MPNGSSRLGMTKTSAPAMTVPTCCRLRRPEEVHPVGDAELVGQRPEIPEGRAGAADDQVDRSAARSMAAYAASRRSKPFFPTTRPRART